MQEIELLSPAGSMESLRAAVQNGAGAVYFGLPAFNARRNAKNIAEDELSAAVAYCHVRGVKVHITLNTLLFDREFSAAAELVEKIARAGADAVIVQDLGVARMVRTVAPELAMHASTQLSIHSVEGAETARRLGFSRVVLARELPLREIARITRESGVETEIFAHGALCMCYSGQCYMSAVIGRRSGNRGMCAQPCRLKYQFPGAAAGEVLSLKDLSVAGYLNRIREMGVACLKIEGRMKRPEYVAAVTRVYADALTDGREPTQEEMELLRRVFSRDGFTTGYLEGKTGAHMFGTRSETGAHELKELYVRARESYENGRENPLVPVAFSFDARRGRMMRLTAVDHDGNRAEVTAAPAQAARTRETTILDVRDKLKMTGGTPYFASKTDIWIDDGLMASVSVLNDMRRRALKELTDARARVPVRETHPFQAGLRRINERGRPGVRASLASARQLSDELVETAPEVIILPLEALVQGADTVRAYMQRGQAFAFSMPRAAFDSEREALFRLVDEACALGVRDAYVGMCDYLSELSARGVRVHGDYGLNITNSQSLKTLRALGFVSATLSFELTVQQAAGISKGMDTEMIVYGRLPLMVFQNCIIKANRRKCACDGVNTLTDRTGRAFPVLREYGCRNALYNATKLMLSDKLADFLRIGLAGMRLLFTTENARECAEVARAYAAGEALPLAEFTRGLYYRGVE